MAAKPIAGTFDLFSQTADGIKNTTTYFSDNTRERVRLPRYFGPDKVLYPYDREKSEGKFVLCMLDEESSKTENYLWHTGDNFKGILGFCYYTLPL